MVFSQLDGLCSNETMEVLEFGDVVFGFFEGFAVAASSGNATSSSEVSKPARGEFELGNPLGVHQMRVKLTV